MRMLRMSYAEQEQLFRRMVFNAVSKNVDDHTKNISYMMDKDGVWKLSPGYDITLSSDSAELFGDLHKMTINGKQKNITIEDLLNVAKNMEIKKGNKIIEQVRDSVARWDTFAGQAEVQNDVRKHVSDLHMKL
jgi:serine/threonine-protein kinase HipA